MNDKFIVLSIVASIIKILGYLTATAGLICAIYYGFIEPNQPGHYFNIGTNGTGVATGVGIVFVGLFKVAIGEIIGVLFAIEINTRR